MRYRKLDPNGDYTFGQRSNEFYVDSPLAVAQAVYTRLRLMQGQWYLDITEGTPWLQQVIGTNTQELADTIIQQRILGTQGVKAILSYSSSLNEATRHFTIAATIDTIYGPTAFTGTLTATGWGEGSFGSNVFGDPS